MIGGEATINDLRRRIAEIEHERDELAAHVERMQEVIAEGFESTEDHDYDTWEKEAKSMLASPPATSLTKRDLIKQAEILEVLLSTMPNGEDAEGCDFGCGSIVFKMALELRQQANQLETDHDSF